MIYAPFQPILEANFNEEEQKIITENWDYYMCVRFGTLSARKFIKLCKEVLAYVAEEDE